MHAFFHKTFASLLITGAVAACGGGSGGSGGGGDNGTGGGGGGGGGSDGSVVFRASCADGSYQCSGSEILRIDNGVALTSAGVQVYGLSTSDLRTPNQDPTNAYGLMLPSCSGPADCGIAEARVARGADGVVSRVVLLLDRLGISWDSRTERPKIIDTFSPEKGRATMDANGVVAFSRNLPPRTDLSFYDYANRGKDGTQSNYANNVYFPRDEPPIRCEQGLPADHPQCQNKESDGVSYQVAPERSWRSGGVEPDLTNAGRFHSDGDLCAGNDKPGPNGEEQFIRPGCDGFGTAYPGFKGYRTYTGWSYGHVTLGSWLTQDTVEIVEWVDDNTPNEHNKIRRGLLAFGELTPANAVPASGSAQYSGIAYGYYVPDGSTDVTFFRGRVSVDANFASRQAGITINDTQSFTDNPAPVPAGFSATATIDSGVQNYLRGPVSESGMSGGVGARLFGPVAANGPAEIGGTFSMKDAAGQTVIGGFIARKQ